LTVFRDVQFSPLIYRQEAEVVQNHKNEHVRNIGQDEAKHKRLNLAGGQDNDRSGDQAVVQEYAR
jgi:hypothetical protein